MEKEPICCPPFKSKDWDNKLLEWNNKKFIMAKVHTFMFMPIDFGKVMAKLQKQVDDAQADMEDYLCLSDHSSKWHMNILLAVNKKIKGANNVTLSGKFYSKVYEGPFKDTGKWCQDFEADMHKKNYQIKKWYMWYTTCPKCAKKYGKNYVVILAELE